MKISQPIIRSLCLFGLWLGLGLQAHAQTDAVTYVYTDPQGTPLVKADASGNVIARYDYTPYGNAVASLGSSPNGPGYTGHVNDPETGLVYMQARYYQPIGRFLSPDPMGPMPGNLFNFSRYAYANNNPIMMTDPTGLESDDNCSAACRYMRKLSDSFSRIASGAWDSLHHASGGGTPIGQLNTMSSYINAEANSELSTASAAVAPVADFVPGLTLASCATGESCGAMEWGAGILAIVPGEGTEASGAAREAYPFIMAGVHGNSAASEATAYLYRLETRGSGFLKWGISKNPARRYTQTFMEGKRLSVMTSGSRREMLNLERWLTEHDPGPLNHERWAGKQSKDIP